MTLNHFFFTGVIFKYDPVLYSDVMKLVYSLLPFKSWIIIFFWINIKENIIKSISSSNNFFLIALV